MRYIALLTLPLLLTGCETFLGKKAKEPLTGERQRVLVVSEEITPSPEVGHIYVGLPDAVHNQEWSMAGGNARHAMLPSLINTNIKKAWERNIGAGNGNSFQLFNASMGFLNSSAHRLLNGPIAAEGKIFTIDAEGTVSATDLKTGEALWQTEAIPSSERSQPFGGGLAYEHHKVYASTANAEVLALDAQKGAIVWRASTSGPVRTAPTVKDGRVFVVTINNQLETFDTNTGKLLWTHMGIIESAGLLGGASPAVHEGMVVVPYSSGEVFALRVENGYPLWSESLSASKRLDSVSSLSHIKARPIIDRNLVFLIGHGGRMSALDLRSGQTVWTKEIGGIRTPAIGGDFLFMATNDNHLVCLQRETGHVLWVQELPRFTNPKEHEGPILWAGPILANHQLVLASSNGRGLILMADTGKKSLEFDLPGPTTLSPILVDKTLIFLTDSATLAAYR